MAYPNVIFKNGEPFQNQTLTINATNSSNLYSCDAPGVQVLTDSWSSCWAFQLPFIMETAGFGYITTFLNMIIIVISIFGHIQESYRWFILNQSFWDLLITYDFICSKPSNTNFRTFNPVIAKELWNQGPSNCFYNSNAASPEWSYFFVRCISVIIKHISFPLVFALSFSRFSAMYFPNFYNSYFNTKKLILLLILFNIFSLFIINFETLYTQFSHIHALNACNCWNCTLRDPCIRSYLLNPSINTAVLSAFAPSYSTIILLLTIISNFGVLFKVISQFKYQYHHNRINLYKTIRITLFLFIQFSTVLCCFILLFFGDVLNFLLSNLLINIFGIPSAGLAEYVRNIPAWLKRLQANSQCINILRSFIDSIMVLVVLTGYRRIVNNFLKWIFFFAKNPKNAIYKLKHPDPSTSSKVISHVISRTTANTTVRSASSPSITRHR